MLGRLGGDPAKLFPRNSSLAGGVIGGAAFTPDGSAPAAVSASINESGVMTWGASGSNDVVGYRVYDVTDGGRSIVTSMLSSGGRSVTVPVGKTYIAVAVDITGMESAPSNGVTNVEVVEETPEPTPDTGTEPTPTPEPGPGTGTTPAPAPAPAPTPTPPATETPDANEQPAETDDSSNQ